MKKKQHVGTIDGTQLMASAKGKLSRNDGIVKSGTGYHKSKKTYNRKAKANQQLRNRLKNSANVVADFLFDFSRVYGYTI